ncbi:MAG: hypothetical protein IM638_14920 [Bacteroidetes bacterium]|nr:hypothetical protein [Bacteroidota bacterium]
MSGDRTKSPKVQLLKKIYDHLCRKASIYFFAFLIIFTFDRGNRFKALPVNTDFGQFESDVAEYYLYLPVFFYGTPEEITANFKANKRTLGMAIMYTPAFLVGDFIARQTGEKLNGYSPPYQKALRWGSIIIVAAGLWFTRKSLRMFFSEPVVMLTLFAIFFGSNLFYYTYGTGEMPHSYEFFLYAVFVYLSLRLILHHQNRNLLWLGIIGGMIVLIRPTDFVILLFPFLFKISTWTDFTSRIKLLTSRRLLLLGSILLFAIPLILQMMIWKKYIDSYVYYSYGKEHFFFNDPQIANFLFSYRKGWLLYTPIMLFALTGILLAWKRLVEFRYFLIIFMVLNIYILSSWWDWGFGGSFGCRALIETYAVLAFSMAVFINWCFTLFSKKLVLKLAFRSVVLVLLYLLIELNLLQTKQYKYLIIHWGGMNEKAYKHVFLRERLEKGELEYYHNYIVKEPDLEKMIRGKRD